MTPLELVALGSIGWACIGLGEATRRAWRRGTSGAVAAPAGSAWPGVAYAFGRGMSPRAKESASQHPWVYGAGILYHSGVAGAVATLALLVGRVPVPSPVARALAFLLLSAAASGLGLLARRRTERLLRAISAPDDYAANLLVDAWLVTAALWWFMPGSSPAFLIATTALGFYAPFGKIRHCVFFFLSRSQFGARLGRRGIVQSRATGVRA